ncbi:tripartite tricarboxylate transporter substrate binding protein [Zeimonas arvi]|uniref:Tripartite tricarboxylate transporter substrate binding protein n=1 Tax=Zeimonas arvi TaxID=2498847 RepID=A0A5C8NVH2_9BURK|nr:tripartite tricarboxylate transporter substrate binding protein [Zeimonas arvi]TXL65215.1 tripartite tricarboxylate transporter substrate binding protein [Zeimonas arvi]
MNLPVRHRVATLSRRRFLAMAAALGAAPKASAANDFPSRAIRILVGFSAGSPSDLLARGVAEKMQNHLGQPVVVENKPGAGGIIAARSLLSAPADGYTLLVVSAAHAAAPVVTRNLGFDPVRDLAGITRIANVPSLLVVSPALGVKSLAELLGRMREAPGKLNFSSPGKGSANHFAGEYMLAEAGVEAIHIPYRGVPEAVSAVMAGDSQFSFVPIPNALPLIASGKLLALATSTGERSKVAPDLPTVAEAGISGYRFDPWFGLLASAGVPGEARATLIAAAVKSLSSPDLASRFGTAGAEISALPGRRFDEYIEKEIAKFRYIATRAKIEPT